MEQKSTQELKTQALELMNTHFLGDANLLKDVIAKFIHEGDAVAPLKKAVEAQDRAQLKSSAHKLKGSVYYFHILEASQLAQSVEHDAETSSWEQLRADVTALDQFVGQILADAYEMQKLDL